MLCIKRFSFGCREIKTKVITLLNQTKLRAKYIQTVWSASLSSERSARSLKIEGNFWNPAKVTQHKRVLRKIDGNWTPDFRFKTCFKNTCLPACKGFKSSTITFCLSDRLCLSYNVTQALRYWMTKGEGSSGGVVVSALASHQCGLGSIPADLYKHLVSLLIY